jgi:hypothetical protein
LRERAGSEAEGMAMADDVEEGESAREVACVRKTIFSSSQETVPQNRYCPYNHHYLSLAYTYRP